MAITDPQEALAPEKSTESQPQSTPLSDLTPQPRSHEPNVEPQLSENPCEPNATPGDGGLWDDTEDPVPDGGYGWIIVLVCFIFTFWQSAFIGAWGIFQSTLLETTLKDSNSSTIAFIGALAMALPVSFNIFVSFLVDRFSARWVGVGGVLVYGTGQIASSFVVHSVPGLFLTCGMMYGLGAGIIYTISNSLPLDWFDRRLGAANGIAKLGGGLGATTMAIVATTCIEKLGIAWTFRIWGFASLATGLPACFLIRERRSPRRKSGVDWHLLTDVPFVLLLLSGAVGCLSIYAPTFFLPTVARSLGLSSSVIAAIVTGFNASMTIGRLGSGLLCDHMGSMNTVLLCMVINAVTILAIWTFASSLAVLLVFALTNALANGAFVVSLPTAAARHAGERRGTGAINLIVNGWVPGLLVGNPIAGFLIDATNANERHGIEAYRPAIFYAGGTALLATALVAASRLAVSRGLFKKL